MPSVDWRFSFYIYIYVFFCRLRGFFVPQKPTNGFVDVALGVFTSATETRECKEKKKSVVMSDGWRDGTSERDAVGGGA